MFNDIVGPQYKFPKFTLNQYRRKQIQRKYGCNACETIFPMLPIPTMVNSAVIQCFLLMFSFMFKSINSNIQSSVIQLLQLENTFKTILRGKFNFKYDFQLPSQHQTRGIEFSWFFSFCDGFSPRDNDVCVWLESRVRCKRTSPWMSFYFRFSAVSSRSCCSL